MYIFDKYVVFVNEYIDIVHKYRLLPIKFSAKFVSYKYNKWKFTINELFKQYFFSLRTDFTEIFAGLYY